VICGGHFEDKVSVETHWKPPHGNFCGKILGLFFFLYFYSPIPITTYHNLTKKPCFQHRIY